LDNEPLHYVTANHEDGARFDVMAQDFWGRFLQLISYVAPRQRTSGIAACKFSASGGMGPLATTVYKKLALMLAEKWNANFSPCCVFWLRCRVSFSLLRSAIMCVRGNRSTIRHPVVANVVL